MKSSISLFSSLCLMRKIKTLYMVFFLLAAYFYPLVNFLLDYSCFSLLTYKYSLFAKKIIFVIYFACPHFFFNKYFKFFHYSWFTMFCQFSTVQQCDSITHTCIHSFFSHYHAPLDIIPNAIQKDLIAYPFQRQ